jgi:serine/threonine protein kinase
MDKYHRYINIYKKGVPEYMHDAPYTEEWSLNTKMQEYEVIKMIGKGAYGTTYLVKRGDKKFIMKKISLTKSKIADILLEVQALKKITKYNNCNTREHNLSSLCLIDDFVDYNTQEYVIVMNYLDNAVTLSTLLAHYKESNKKISLDDVIFIMSRLISQLDNLHTNGIVHNDIKPDNIIIQYVNHQIKNVLFIDFGVSCIKVCRPSGTIIYLAPELYRIINHTPDSVLKIKEKLLEKDDTRDEGKTIPINKSDYMKTDVYSLGVVFYEMLHNKMPYPYKPDYIREQSKYYREHPLDFELDVLSLKNKKEELYNYIQDLDVSNIDDDEETPEEKEERIRDYKIDAYLRESLPEVLSPEAVLGYYNYYKRNPIFESSYQENESGNPRIAEMINNIVNQMLIVNPLRRQSIHRLKGQFNKVIMQLLSENYFKSVSSPRRLISPLKE